MFAKVKYDTVGTGTERDVGQDRKDNDSMRLFGKVRSKETYDPINERPMIKASICNGEQVAGFVDVKTGAFHEIMLIRYDADLDEFRRRYGITGEIGKIY